MSQESTERDGHQQERDDGAKRDSVKKHRRRIFYGAFWSEHPVAIVGAAIATILVSPITSFPGGQKKDFWYVVSGLVLWAAIVVYWLIDGLLKLRAPTEEEINEGFRQKTNDALSQLGAGLHDANSSLDSVRARIAFAEKGIDSLTPRVLSPSDKLAIVEALKPFPEQRIDIRWLVSDGNAAAYALHFQAAFHDAGWQVFAAPSPSIPNFHNAVVTVNPEDDAAGLPQAVTALIDVLDRLKLTSHSITHIAIPRGQVVLYIGAKPTSQESTC